MAHDSHSPRLVLYPLVPARSVSVARGKCVTTSIVAVLNADPLSREIVVFLLQNDAAMDTAKGIAKWWVRRDELAVQAALDRLIACGVITPHTFASGILYGLTRNQEIRDWLLATYGPSSIVRDFPPSDATGAAVDT